MGDFASSLFQKEASVPAKLLLAIVCFFFLFALLRTNQKSRVKKIRAATMHPMIMAMGGELFELDFCWLV